MNRISAFLEDKTVFLTGATGFLGQATVEKILWAAPGVRRINLLIRPKRQLGSGVSSAEDRLEKEVLSASVFDRLREAHGDQWRDFLKGKLFAVEGDISKKHLGLDDQAYSRSCKETDVIINSAALVSFDAPLDDALEQNILSAQGITEFAGACQKAVLIHVSTAYVSGAATGTIPETSYHSVQPGEAVPRFPRRKFTDLDYDIKHIEQILHRIRTEAQEPALDRQFKQALLRRFRKSRSGRNVRRREKIENLRRKWIKNRLTEEGMKWARQRGWNDTYTYTKAIGERTIVTRRGQVPTVIIRPSVIESSLAEPSPGWLDGLRMADPLIAAIGKGRLRSLPLNPNVTIDLVPVDLVVNALLASIPEVARTGGLQIYHVATGSQNPITLGQLYALIYRYFRKNPLPDRSGNPIRIRRLRFPNPSRFRLQHRLKAVPLNTAERTLERLPALATEKFKRRISATKVAHERLYYYGEIYEPYLNLDCCFEVDNTTRLFGSLDEEEKKLFHCDVTQLNWRHYVQNVHIPGIKKYLLKMDEETVREATEKLSFGQPRPTTINELLANSAAQYPSKTALQIKRDGRWDRFTFEEVKQKADGIGNAFRRSGFHKGDRVVLYSENQPEWGLVCLGAVSAGLIVVPLDSQTSRQEVWSVARFTEARAILASEGCFDSFTSEELRVNESSESPIKLLNVNQLCAPFSLDEYPRSTQAGEGCNLDEVPLEPVEIGPDDLASILFTTSTAVDPRGAMHTHGSFLNNLFGVNQHLPIYETDNLLSVLPLYHALEFTCGFLLAIYGGATVTYTRSLRPRVILETMRETGTTCMLGVPTLYALIRDDVERRISRTSRSALKSNLMATSKQVSRSVERTLGKNIGRQLFARVHREFGRRIRIFVSGGSALGEQLYEDFKALGMPIYEGYGLSETAPVLTVNPFRQSRKASAGKRLSDVELRISHPDKNGIGEIIVRSSSLMTGYYKNPAATKKAIRDGWFHTGDLGWMDEDGYLYITGRIKDVIVTGAGKNVYPVDLEAIYKGLPTIQQICVLGIKNDLTEDVHAVIVPSSEVLGNIEEGVLRRTIQREVQEVAKEVPSYQRLQHLYVWPEPLPLKETGEVDRGAVRRKLLEELTEVRRGEPQTRIGSSGKGMNPEQEVLEELSRLSSVPAEKITQKSNLYSDLGLDSLRAIELLLFLERRFTISIPDGQASAVQSVGDLFVVLRSKKRHHKSSGDPRKRTNLRSALPYSQRSSLNRCLLGLSLCSLRAIYKTYFDLQLRFPKRLLNGTACILAANHSSHLDTGAVISAVSTSLGIKEAQKLHVLGATDYFFNRAVKRWFFTTFLNVVPIEREETSLAGLHMVSGILSSGESVLIFPEGTRSRTGEIQPFRPGLGLIAYELNVPIVPVHIEGTFQALPVGKILPVPKQVTVTFGSPIRVDAYRSGSREISADEVYRKVTADVRKAIELLSQKR